MGLSETSAFRPEPLTIADVARAMALSSEAGWNQTEDDWRIFITRGATFGIRDEGRLAATAAALPYEGFGFVSMVLTTAAQRGRGFATTLLAHAVQALTASGIVPVLDATPAGRPVYERQGFVAVDDIQRWARADSPDDASVVPTRPGASDPPRGEADRLAHADAVAFGARRGFLFDDFLVRLRTISVHDDGGFVLSRGGRTATQIGPLVAADEPHALSLLERVVARLYGPLVIDVPARWKRLAAWLEEHAFQPQRPFTRMALRHAAPFGNPARLFATAGPEFG